MVKNRRSQRSETDISMALFSAGSSLIYHLAPFVLNVITTPLLFILLLVVFPKTLFSARYSSSCTLPLSVLLSVFLPSTTTFTQMILNSSSLSTHSTLTEAFLTFKTPLTTHVFLDDCTANLILDSSKTAKTEFLLIRLKKNLPKYITLYLTALLEILASSLTKILLSLTELHL